MRRLSRVFVLRPDSSFGLRGNLIRLFPVSSAGFLRIEMHTRPVGRVFKVHSFIASGGVILAFACIYIWYFRSFFPTVSSTHTPMHQEPRLDHGCLFFLRKDMQGPRPQRNETKGLEQQVRGLRGRSPLCKVLVCLGAHIISLVQQNSVQICHTTGHKAEEGSTCVVNDIPSRIHRHHLHPLCSNAAVAEGCHC